MFKQGDQVRFKHPNPHNTGESIRLYHDHVATVIGPKDERLYDRPDVGPMYVVKFYTGYDQEVFEDELTLVR